MSNDEIKQVRELVDAVYRAESRRVLATLIRLLGDFDAAEEALHEAFTAAVERWPRDGVPANPRAWLVSTGRFKAIDGMRRRARFDASLPELSRHLETDTGDREERDDESLEDDRLRLIFTCCHPALSPEAQVAMTLREVCGLTTEEIARAFLTSPPTVAQRIVRAKAKIRDARIPYHVPSRDRFAGPSGRRAAGDLPGVQRRILRLVGRIADAARSVRRGDTAGTIADGAAAGAGGDGTAGADAAAGIAARRAHLADGRVDSAGRSGSLAVESRSRSRKALRWWSGRWRHGSSVPTRSRRRSPRCMPRRLAPEPRTGRRSSALYDAADASESVAGGGTESRRRGGNA